VARSTLKALTIKALRLPERETGNAPGENLYLRLYPDDCKRWYVRKMKDGSLLSRPLGYYPRMRISDAKIERDNVIEGAKSGARECALSSALDELVHEEDCQDISPSEANPAIS